MSEPRDHTDLRDAAHHLLQAISKPDVDPRKVKQVLVMRVKYPDGKGGKRKLRLGKYVAQGAHGAMKTFFDRIVSIEWNPGARNYTMTMNVTPEMAAWASAAFTKIVVGVDSEEDLLRCHELAQEAGIPSALITDSGATEFSDLCPDCAKPLGKTGMIVQQPIACLTCGGTGKVPRPTNTCVCLGPALVEDIDKITGPGGAVKVRLL